MATPRATWVGNLNGATEPLIIRGLFNTGATEAIKAGEMIKLSTTYWEPVDQDESLTAALAVMGEEIKTGDLAGYYEIIVPREGDIFRYQIATAAASVLGTQYGYSTSQKLYASASSKWWTNCGQSNYPQKQGHASDGDPADRGTTVKNLSYVDVTCIKTVSYYAILVK